MATTISNGESGSSVRTKLNNIWEGLELNEIAATISDTAVDIFVYDTRKDSDGGAWRKRTQHTSWYNETLNTATRGSRKEFPAVAVIVAESNQVTIYDGDDPDLPMWMVFSAGGNGALSFDQVSGSAPSNSSTASLNGVVCVTQNGSGNGQGVRIISFLAETVDRMSDSARSSTYRYLGNISQRNSGLGGYAYSSAALVNLAANDVAVTVLPNAPIDEATGLPVNTIAVATNGGVSVIKDDGTVVDIVYSSSPVITSVDASPKRMLFSATNGVVFASGYPTADVSSSSFSTLAGLLPDGAGYYSTTIPAVLGTVSKVAV